MKINYGRIGRQIRDIRCAKGLTQEELAEMINVSTSFISKIERGIRHPGLETMISIASALGTTIDVLLIGNQSGDKTIYQRELRDVMKNCSNKEQELILSVAKAMKSGFDSWED